MANLFKCGGGTDPRKLYNALRYSLIVNKNMSYNEMLTALRKAFPKTFSISWSGSTSSHSTGAVISTKTAPKKGRVESVSGNVYIGHTGAKYGSTITVYVEASTNNSSWDVIASASGSRGGQSRITLYPSFDRKNAISYSNKYYTYFRLRYSSTDNEKCDSSTINVTLAEET